MTELPPGSESGCRNMAVLFMDEREDLKYSRSSGERLSCEKYFTSSSSSSPPRSQRRALFGGRSSALGLMAVLS